MSRVWLRPVLITLAALVVVAAVGVWTHAPHDTGACVAPSGAQQQDVDPDDTPETPWPHVPGEGIVVHVATGGLPARYAGLVEQAAEIWGRSPCVDPVVVDVCPAQANCSTVVTRERSPDGDTDGESESDDRGGVRRANTITLYTELLDEASDDGALATVVHELGHAFGLVHRLDPESVMNAETDDATDPVPDAIDFANLVAIYG